MPNLSLSGGLSAGDILTAASVLVSVVALLAAWASQRHLQRREQADKVRSAASRTLARLERWLELNLWLFDYVQPTFVEADEKLAAGADILVVRDYLWKAINSSRIEIKRHVLDEEIETAYVDLYAYQPATYELFVSAMNKLRRSEEELFDDYLSATQSDVMSFETKRENYVSSKLGNKLRSTNYEFRERLRATTSETLRPIYGFLVDIITERDRSVLRRPDSVDDDKSGQKRGVPLVPSDEPFAASEPQPLREPEPKAGQSHRDDLVESDAGETVSTGGVASRPTVCPHCGGRDFTPLREGNGPPVQRCDSCGQIYTLREGISRST